MMGEDGTFGRCGVTCGSCTPCAPDDAACRVAQREQLGYLGNLEAELQQLFPEG